MILKRNFSSINDLRNQFTTHYDNLGKIKWNKSANGYRFPTKDEWEYAAKGGENYKYAGSDDVTEIAWFGYYDEYDDNRTVTEEGTKAVGQKKENDYGLYDMCGNVWEWCFDIRSEGASDYTRKGGAWYNSDLFCAIQHSSGSPPSERGGGIGVRLCKVHYE